MVFFSNPGWTCNPLASKWALLSLASSRQMLLGRILSKLTWGGCGAASLKTSKTHMDLHTLMTVSEREDNYSATVCQINISNDSSPFSPHPPLPHQMWKLKTSPWVSCAAQISLRWPGVWSTRLQLIFHAHVMVPAGMPSFYGSLCPTSLHLCQTLLPACFFLHPTAK